MLCYYKKYENSVQIHHKSSVPPFTNETYLRNGLLAGSFAIASFFSVIGFFDYFCWQNIGELLFLQKFRLDAKQVIAQYVKQAITICLIMAKPCASTIVQIIMKSRTEDV